jgi:hypothetical protein
MDLGFWTKSSILVYYTPGALYFSKDLIKKIVLVGRSISPGVQLPPAKNRKKAGGDLSFSFSLVRY